LQDYKDDDDIYYCYDKAHITGSDFAVQDNGVDITANAVDLGDNRFYLTENPVGNVTISGTGSLYTLNGIFEWGAGKLGPGLSFVSTYAEDPSPSVTKWLDSQRETIEFLSSLASFYDHSFDILNLTLTLVHQEEARGSLDLSYRFFTLEVMTNEPASKWISKWNQKKVVEYTDNFAVEDEEKEVSILGPYSYGTEFEVESFLESVPNVETRLNAINNRHYRMMLRCSIPLEDVPGYGLPRPGMEVTLVHPYFGSRGLVAVFNIRELTYHFDPRENTIDLAGDGTITGIT
jgi:hypothetical protein